MELVDDRPAISHDEAARNELARRRRMIALILLAAVAALGLAAWGIVYDLLHGYDPNGRTRADGTREGGNGVFPVFIALACLGVAVPRVVRFHRLRRAIRECTWHEAEFSGLDSATPRLARPTYGTHWYKFPKAVPRHFRAAIASCGTDHGDARRWCAIRPFESDRPLLTRVQIDEARRRPEPPNTDPGAPRWRIDEMAVDCRLTPAGLERASSDRASVFPTCALHRPQEGPWELWVPRGPRLGRVEAGDRGLELHDELGALVVELERRFDVNAFWHKGLRVGSWNRSQLRVGDCVLSCGPWRRWSRLSGSRYRLVDGDGDVAVSARQSAWGGHVSVWIAPRIEPVAAAVIVLQLVELIRRRWFTVD